LELTVIEKLERISQPRPCRVYFGILPSHRLYQLTAPEL
jgi:hypothetical protein